MKVFRKHFKYFLFSHQHIQTHTDFVNQTDNIPSMWTTKNGCSLTLHARLSTFEFSVRGTWMISKFRKFAFKILMSSRYISMLAILLVLKPSSPIENNILQTWPETDANSSYTPLLLLMPPPLQEEVKESPKHFLPPSIHQNPLRCYTNLVMSKAPCFSTTHM